MSKKKLENGTAACVSVHAAVRYLYCRGCGAAWRDNYSLHDTSCPGCMEYFMDGNIEIITKVGFEAIAYE